MRNVWTGLRLQELERRWRLGQSASQIREALNLRSRHQVSGKVRRLGLLRRRDGGMREIAAGGDARSRHDGRRERWVAKDLSWVTMQFAPPPEARCASLWRLEDWECRWPLAVPDSRDAFETVFCGAPIEIEAPRPRLARHYCKVHAPLALQRGQRSETSDEVAI